MQSWQEELGIAIGNPELTVDEVFALIASAAKGLGFDHVAYGVRLPSPMSELRTGFISNYPIEWQRRYAEAGYLSIDPSVAVGQRSYKPLLWSDALFASAKPLWDDAREFGLRHGWAQSSREGNSTGLVTLARSEPITSTHLQSNEPSMRWLANVAHLALVHRLAPQTLVAPTLTESESEILRWAADGRTSREIADKLKLADALVKLHLANAMRKLDVSSYTAASVKAEMLRVLGPRLVRGGKGSVARGT